MRNEKRIKPFLKYLEQEWTKNPDWRFGQLLTNLDISADYHSDIEDYPLPFFVKRKVTFWGKFKGMKYVRKYGYWASYDYISLDKLKEDHIKNILKTQKTLKGQPIEKLLKAELKFRKIKKRTKHI